MKSVRLAGVMIASGILIAVGFQNCAPQNGSPSAEVPLSSNQTSGTANIDSSKVIVNVYSSEAVQVDCSVEAGIYRYEILNASSNILLCQQYSLDMPVGSARRGEIGNCDTADKFSPPSAGWSYDAASRVWSRQATTKNHPTLVPGDFTLFVKDANGEVYTSNLLRVRRNGAVNCNSTESTGGSASSAAAKTCGWVGDDFSPTMTPTSLCNQTRENQKEYNINRTEYTCRCVSTVVTNPMAPISNTPGMSSSMKCNPAGTTLKIVNTSLVVGQVGHPRTNYYPKGPGELYSFAFKTANSSSSLSGRAYIAPTSGAYPGYEVAISECPGSIDKNRVEIGCYTQGVEGIGRTLVAGNITWQQYDPTGKLARGSVCLLKPNTQYYFTVYPSPSGSNPCRDATTCGFSFLGN